MKTWMTMAACAASLAAATPTQAQISADLAKQCRAMMVQAYPSTTYGTAVSAAKQRDYFQDCIKRQGKMDSRSPPEATPDDDRHRVQ
jgi:hypothetical protein